MIMIRALCRRALQARYIVAAASLATAAVSLVLAFPLEGRSVIASLTRVLPVRPTSAPATASITPAGGTFYSPSLPVTINWYDEHGLDGGTRTIQQVVGGVMSDVTGSFDYVESDPTTATSTGTITLPVGASYLLAAICDIGGDCMISPPGTLPPIWTPAYAEYFHPEAEMPTAVITPAGGTFTGATLGVTIGWSDNHALDGASRSITLNGQNVVGQFGYVLSDTANATSNGVIDLQPGTNVLTAAICDESGNCMDSPLGRPVTAIYIYNVGANPVHPGVDVKSVNPGRTIERSLCLTVAVGRDGAAECGDLRLAHTLPPTRTMNRWRQPILTYNSQHAHPFPYVHASVSLAGSTIIPDSVTATLSINSLQRAYGKWPGNQWSAGGVRRIALGFDAIADSTGVYAYTLEVKNHYNATQKAASVSGELTIVNRSNSYFGAGWWLAGIERLYPSSMLWVGGDGSVRKYEQVQPSVWVAPRVDQPDTIKLSGGKYIRYLKERTQVKFNATGEHIITEPRLGNAHADTFEYASGMLTKIKLAVPSGAPTREYELAYTSSKIQSVMAPPESSTSRVTNVTVTSGRMTSIQDPDTRTVSFGYDPGFANRITSRTNRLGYVTTFKYDPAHKLWKDSLGMGSAQPIVTTLRSVESQVRSPTAKDPAALYALVDGPRTSIADTTAFFVDRFGAPSKIRNALADSTVLLRNDTLFPALVTEIIHPDGFREQATYNDRGNIKTRTQVAPYGPGTPNAVTRYSYNPAIFADFPTSIVPPEGDSLIMSYGATGQLFFRQDARGSLSQVDFTYYTSGPGKGMVMKVDPPLAPADSFVYDTYGNLSSVRTAKLFLNRFWKDAIGRDTLIERPTGPSAPGGPFHKQRTVYDVMGRDTLGQTIGPVLNGVPQQTVTVRKEFDAESQLTRLARRSTPDPASIDTIITRWTYDAAGRVTAEIAPDGTPGNPNDNPRDSTVYDPAGNAIAVHTRRVPYVMTMTYDVLNRLTHRNLPQVSYAARNQGIPEETYFEYAFGEDNPYPWYPNDGGTGYRILADVDSFRYDPRGNLTLADNTQAQVRRAYYPNGLLKADTQRIATVAGGGFNQHEYILSYTYDRNGRRLDVVHPAQLRAGTVRDRTSYSYHPQLGALTTVTDLLGKVFTYGYDAKGRPSTFARPGGILDTLIYDEDDRLINHRVKNNSTSAYKYSGPYLRQTTLTYDARSKLLSSKNSTGPRDTLTSLYSGLGHVIDGLMASHGQANNTNSAESTSRETLTHDALGNIVTINRESSYFTAGFRRTHQTPTAHGYQAGTGRLLSSATATETDTYVYDAAGNVEFVTTAALTGSPEIRDRASWYDAAGRVRASDTRNVTEPNVVLDHDLARVFEEYRYDALGRRVWVRARRWCKQQNADYEGFCQLSTVRRTVWDGDQELWEIQMPGEDGSAHLENDTAQVALGMFGDLPGDVSWPQAIDPNPLFGRLAYTHAGAQDQPVGIIRIGYGDLVDQANGTRPHRALAPFLLAPVWNERGQPMLGVFDDGGLRRCDTSQPPARCVYVGWPELYFAYVRPSFARAFFWHGSLLQDKQDGSGTSYRRNRYYDPESGRFTQEDPIGLAGGLNLYGFANGDPVNFSDPFGLCPEEMGGDGKTSSLTDCPRGSKGYARVVGGVDEAIGPLEAIGMLLTPAVGLRAIAGRVFGKGAADAGKRIFSARVLRRMADEPGPFHNFPQAIGREVFERGQRTVIDDDYVLYTLRGTVNGVEGVYEVGVRPSISGRNEVITHWFFRPDRR
jgi:RHS repeat-associated protein